MLKNIPDTFTKNVRDVLILDNKFVYLLNSSLYSSRKSFITPFISLLNDIPVCFFYIYQFIINFFLNTIERYIESVFSGFL